MTETQRATNTQPTPVASEPAGLESAALPCHPVAAATTEVELSAISKSGISSLRILSQSKFIEVLRSMVEDSLADRLEELKAELPSSGDPEAAVRLEKAYHAKWKDLRVRHEASLGEISGRMEKLSRAFRTLEKLFEKAQRSSPAAVLPAAVAAPPGRKQKALLRQLLMPNQ